MKANGTGKPVGLFETLVQRIEQLEARVAELDKPSRLLTVGDAASRLGMSSSYIRAAIRDGRLPEHRLGRAVRVAIADVDALVSASTRRAAPVAKPTDSPIERAARVEIGKRR